MGGSGWLKSHVDRLLDIKWVQEIREVREGGELVG
jgi:hypothetical protein